MWLADEFHDWHEGSVSPGDDYVTQSGRNGSSVYAVWASGKQYEVTVKEL